MKRFDNYIDGQWTSGSKTFENRNPANTDEVVGVFTAGDPSEVEAAASAAAGRFPAWSQLAGPARGNYLFKVADILDRRFDQIAADMTREEGKTLPEAKGEVRRSINIFRYFAGEGSRMPGMLVPSERDRVHMFAIRKPIGVVGLITPWNFPSAIPAWKLAPALICGNTVVIKPASAAPLSAWRIVEALHEAGIPKGVVNFVAGSRRRTGPGAGGCEAAARRFVHRLLRDRPLAARRSVQAPPAHSARNGRQESDHRAGRRRFQFARSRTWSTPRSSPPARSAPPPAAPSWKTRSTTASSTALVERTRKLKVGDGMQPGIEIGPCVDQGQMETVLRYIEIGRKEAGEPRCGGRRLTGGGSTRATSSSPRSSRTSPRDAHRAGGDLRPGARRHAREGFRGRHAHRQQHPVRAFVVDSDDQSLAARSSIIYRAEAGLLTVNLPSAGVEYQLAVRRHQGLELRPEGAGSGGARILQRSTRPFT